MTPLNHVHFVNKFCSHFGVQISNHDLVEICNVLTMINNFLYDFNGNDAELRSTQVKSYIVYNELTKRGYDISSKTYGETDWEGYLD